MAELRRTSLLFFLVLLLIPGCSRLSVLNQDALGAARQQWESSGPAYYTMMVEMKGDRVETSEYEVTVRSKEVVKLLRNGEIVSPGDRGQDYTVEGLFHIMDQEIDLATKPEVLGAPPGYASYPFAKFDSATGRLLRFQRSVGGVKNSIEINVKDFKVLGQ